MIKSLFLTLALLASVAAPTHGQDAADGERESVKKVVETYLFTEDVEEKRRTLHPDAKIFSTDATSGRITVSTISKLKARVRKGVKTLRNPQRVVAVDVYGNAASVKVATDFAPDEKSLNARQIHYQFLSLLKAGGEWQIVGILMPAVTRIPNPTGN